LRFLYATMISMPRLLWLLLYFVNL